jgi:hypothetical protein
VKVAKTVKNLPTFGSFRKVRYYLIIPKSGTGHQCTDYLPLTLLQPTGRGKIGKMIFRATVKDGSKTAMVAACLMNEDVSENSSKYAYYRNQAFELQSIIENHLRNK